MTKKTKIVKMIEKASFNLIEATNAADQTKAKQFKTEINTLVDTLVKELEIPYYDAWTLAGNSYIKAKDAWYSRYQPIE